MGLLSSAMSTLSTGSAVDANQHSLNAFLTFVALPITSILASILDQPTKPIFGETSKSHPRAATADAAQLNPTSS